MSEQGIDRERKSDDFQASLKGKVNL